MSQDWEKPLPLRDLARGPISLGLEPDEAERAAIARTLKLEGLPSLRADLTVKPWMDGVQVTGQFRAVVEQVCGVTLDPFEQVVQGEIDVLAVPPGSPHAPQGEGGEVDLDPDGPEPPDVLDGDLVDVAGYVVEHLALELDPFPRKPGATFDYQPPADESSPFAALKGLGKPKP